MEQQNKDINRYIKDIKRTFPSLGKNEKMFLNKFKDNLLNNSLDSYEYDYLIENFGTPNEIVNEYYEDKEIPKLKNKGIRKTIIVLIFITIICFIFLLIKEMNDSRNSYVNREIVELNQ